MKRLYFTHLILCGVWALSLNACIHKPSKSMKTEQPIAPPPAPVPQQTVLLEEARLNADNLRAELASLKILMAKQAGELRSLREQSHSIQQREHDQGLQLQNIRAELMTSQAERDQLRRRNMELESQVATIPKTTELLSDIQSVKGSFEAIMSKISGLVSDISLIKQEIGVTQPNPKPKQARHQGNSHNPEQTPDAKGRVLIREGDTLWELSLQYGTTVDQLREWNNLSSDLIRTGFWLKVMVPSSQPTQQAQAVEDPSKVQTIKIEKHAEVPQAITDTSPPQDHSSPNSTHILSIGGPSPDSDETP